MSTDKMTRGRRKLEMKRIENEDQRLVTFSKRKTGLYNKGCDICCSCDVEMAIVIFSPSNKPFSFAHPSIQHVTRRFFNQPATYEEQLQVFEDNRRKASVNALNEQLDAIVDSEVGVRIRIRDIEIAMGDRASAWWLKPVEELGLNETTNLLGLIEGIHRQLHARINEILSGYPPQVAAVGQNQTTPLVIGQNQPQPFVGQNQPQPWFQPPMP